MKLSLPNMGATWGLDVWKDPTSNICEWRFDPPLDQDDMVTVVNRSDVHRRLKARWSDPVPFQPSSGVITYNDGEPLKVKIAPEQKNPHFRMIPEDERLKNEWLFSWTWRLQDEGINDQEH